MLLYDQQNGQFYSQYLYYKADYQQYAAKTPTWG